MKRRRKAISVGADLGRTWLRVAAADASGRILKRARLPAPKPDQLRRAFQRLFRHWRIQPNFLILGTTGAGNDQARKKFRRLLSGLASKVHIKTDLEIARRAAFGNGPGILIIAGTGSGVWGGDACGHNARAGGLGPLLGDEGSGFWIGREWLKSRPDSDKILLRLAHQLTMIETIQAVARYAPRALAQIGRNRNADAIVRKAVAALVAQAEKAARALHFGRAPTDSKGGGGYGSVGRSIPVSCYGGLFQNAVFRKLFLKELLRKKGCDRIPWSPQPPRMNPEISAALFPFKTGDPNYYRID